MKQSFEQLLAELTSCNDSTWSDGRIALLTRTILAARGAEDLQELFYDSDFSMVALGDEALPEEVVDVLLKLALMWGDSEGAIAVGWVNRLCEISCQELLASPVRELRNLRLGRPNLRKALQQQEPRLWQLIAHSCAELRAAASICLAACQRDADAVSYDEIHTVYNRETCLAVRSALLVLLLHLLERLPTPEANERFSKIIALCENMIARQNPLANAIAVAVLVRAREGASMRELDALKDPICAPETVPYSWGWIGAVGRPLTTKNIATITLTWALRVPTNLALAFELTRVPPSFPHARIEAVCAAIRLAAAPKYQEPVYGLVRGDLGDRQLEVLRRFDSPHWSVPDMTLQEFGFYVNGDISRFLQGKGVFWRPMALKLNGAIWNAHFGAIWRRTVAGDLNPGLAGQNLVAELPHSALFHLVVSKTGNERKYISALRTLHSSAEEEERCFRLWIQIVRCLCRSGFDLVKYATRLAPRHTRCDLLAVAIDEIFRRREEPFPGDLFQFLIVAAKGPDSAGAVRRVLARLPKQRLEPILASDAAWEYCDLAVTPRVAERVLLTSNLSPDEAFKLLSYGDLDTLSYLRQVTPRDETQSLTVMMAIEAIEERLCWPRS